MTIKNLIKEVDQKRSEILRTKDKYESSLKELHEKQKEASELERKILELKRQTEYFQSKIDTDEKTLLNTCMVLHDALKQ